MKANKYSCFLSRHYDILIETCKGYANVYLKVNIVQNEICINETKFAELHIIYTNVQFSQFLSLPSNNFTFVIKPHILIIDFGIESCLS